MSCTNARPKRTSTFCVMFWTGRMSLLYPRKRSRTNRSSSSEHSTEEIKKIKTLIVSSIVSFYFLLTIMIADYNGQSQNQCRHDSIHIIGCVDPAGCRLLIHDITKNEFNWFSNTYLILYTAAATKEGTIQSDLVCVFRGNAFYFVNIQILTANFRIFTERREHTFFNQHSPACNVESCRRKNLRNDRNKV